MTAYLNKTITKTQTIPPGKSVELWFQPGSAGVVTLTAVVSAKPPPKSAPGAHPAVVAAVLPARHRLQLFCAGVDRPLVDATRDDASSTLTHAVSAQEAGHVKWYYRLSNLDRAIAYTATVRYPTAIELRTESIELALIHQLAGPTVASLQLHLQSGAANGDKASWLDVDDDDIRRVLKNRGVKLPLAFEVPRIRAWDAPGKLKDTMASVHDLNSSSIALAIEAASAELPRGALHVWASFEEAGPELVLEGWSNIQLTPLKIDVRLGLAVRGGLISWDTVEVDFSTSAEAVTWPGWLVALIVNTRDIIRTGVEGFIKQSLTHGKTRKKVAKTVTKFVRGLAHSLTAKVTIYGVTVTEAALVVTYYED
ncbi:hypothetical protein [Nannocystis sp.]|uniref:hypothetical protein n=1 Tax=Nannocystis sp. TaxID=1962667 RepID=UPI002425C2CD|nr:hypothetical protein [Nannocystis sp.]MBK7827607.1 hypothetical protein [Nannocystis sp.]MBK9756493.1 hypothetical protein [Nannocystis sp.]